MVGVQTPALVTGASRGFGRAVAAALTAAGVPVIGVARSAPALRAAAAEVGFTPVVGDVTSATLAAALLREHRPGVVVLNAGSPLPMGPLHTLSWADFSVPWNADTRHVFEWTTAALRLPLAPGSLVVVVSSGAALAGSPVSGGYAGAKATTRFIASYAADESARAGLGLRFVTLFPQLTPATGFGAAAVAAYAERSGVSVEEAVAGMGDVLTPEQVGSAVVAALSSTAGLSELRVGAAGVEAVA